MSYGFGVGEFGIMPCGLLTPDEANAPADPSGLCRAIDPETKSYAFDADTGQLAQVGTVQQRVYLAVSTVAGSSTALPRFGIAVPNRGDRSHVAVAQQAVRLALRHLTDVERVIEIVSVDVTSGTRRLAIVVQYRNLETGELESVEA